MDALRFDRLVRSLSDRLFRRDALRALVGGGVVVAAGAADDAAARKKKRPKRCRKPGATCGPRKKCCQGDGSTLCQAFANPLCQGVDLTGNRCCGVEGTICDPEFGTSLIQTDGSHGNCSCCADLYCGEQLDGSFRCQTEET
ncbi:MAG: hypothetical protein JNM64_02545 [Chloroflexia bacterium]|nr:hypothetical protein [Chloroflexia bacterium]